jgi:hypothetical protein
VCFQMEVEDRRRAYGEEHEDKAEPSALSDALIEAFCILDRAPVAANLWTPHPPLGTSFPLASPGISCAFTAASSACPARKDRDYALFTNVGVKIVLAFLV